MLDPLTATQRTTESYLITWLWMEGNRLGQSTIGLAMFGEEPFGSGVKPPRRPRYACATLALTFRHGPCKPRSPALRGLGTFAPQGPRAPPAKTTPRVAHASSPVVSITFVD